MYAYCFQIFEWWYFKKYGTSFIEQVSLNHISPLLGGGEGGPDVPNGTVTTSNSITNTATPDSSRSTSSQQSSVPGAVVLC